MVFDGVSQSLMDSLREKCPKYGVISSPYFPVFGLITEIYFVFI